MISDVWHVVKVSYMAHLLLLSRLPGHERLVYHLLSVAMFLLVISPLSAVGEHGWGFMLAGLILCIGYLFLKENMISRLEVPDEKGEHDERDN